MTLLDKAIKALERISSLTDTSREAFESSDEWTLEYARGIHRIAADALAELRAFREKPPGFPEWWSKYLGESGFTRTQSDVQAAYTAGHLRGQLSGMPEELRETLMEACRIARDTMRPEFDDARKWLEEGR